MRALLFGTAGCVLLLGLFVLFKPGNPPAPVAATPATASAAAPATPAVHKFELKVANKKLVDGPNVLRVQQGEVVELCVLSDQAEEVHLHGYNLKVDLLPNQTATLQFVADRSGRFDYELEHSGIGLGALEVSPR